MVLAVSNHVANLIDHVQTCIAMVESGADVLPKGVLELEGFSNRKVRNLLNLLNTPPNLRYLEVGVWKGSTFVAANYQIKKFEGFGSVAVDNFCEFNGEIARPMFCNTAWEWLGASPTLVQGPVFSDEVRDELCVIAETENPFAIYLYDGGHTGLEQCMAITHIEPFLADVGILIVDDYSRPEVVEGTKDGIAKAGWRMHAEHVLTGADGWWEGLYVAVWERPGLDDEQTLDENFCPLDDLG